MIILILLVAALVFGVLALAGVPSRISWTGLGVVCLAVAALLARSFG